MQRQVGTVWIYRSESWGHSDKFEGGASGMRIQSDFKPWFSSRKKQQTTATVARRMVENALGKKATVTAEKRQEERNQLAAARAAKKNTIQWDWTLNFHFLYQPIHNDPKKSHTSISDFNNLLPPQPNAQLRPCWTSGFELHSIEGKFSHFQHFLFQKVMTRPL